MRVIRIENQKQKISEGQKQFIQDEKQNFFGKKIVLMALDKTNSIGQLGVMVELSKAEWKKAPQNQLMATQLLKKISTQNIINFQKMENICVQNLLSWVQSRARASSSQSVIRCVKIIPVFIFLG